MHKLSLYLNDNQYEKLEVLQEHSPFDTPEEYANEVFYDALLAKWLRYKSDSLKHLLETGDYDEEIKRVTLDGTEYEVWCDGEGAVISARDFTFSLQRIEGKLYYVLENGHRICCPPGTAKDLERVFELTGYTLRDFTKEVIEEIDKQYSERTLVL